MVGKIIGLPLVAEAGSPVACKATTLVSVLFDISTDEDQPAIGTSKLIVFKAELVKTFPLELVNKVSSRSTL